MTSWNECTQEVCCFYLSLYFKRLLYSRHSKNVVCFFILFVQSTRTQHVINVLHSFGSSAIFPIVLLGVPLVIQLHFNDGPALRRHARPYRNALLLVHQAVAIAFGTLKVYQILVVVHELVQLLVAARCLLEKAHCMPVFIDVVVERHGEHNGNQISACFGTCIKQIVGHDTHSPGGRVVVLGEGAHLSLVGKQGGLCRAVDKAAIHVDPVGWRENS